MIDVHNNPGALLKALLDMINGFENDLPPGVTQISTGGKVTTIAELVSEIQGYTTLYKAVDDARLAHDNAIVTRNASAPIVITRFLEIRGALKTTLGKTSPNLHKFGVAPNQIPAPLTVEQKTARAAKAKATRAARHTLGPKQKKAIKGQVPPSGEPPPPPPVK